ncbi:D-alanyl-lipoteichoic acid biosynthesis protein DltB [Paucilactobacillus nenjiangensis]|uniref:Teichoic acid D-alanyltransferase n=1 Tax=Paucilactobacillus nenjiangensis TaxID=1296540 RepID=A0A5P1X2Y5_9LACO|nr:D-alanyl-lipoteichoic acid biosynthesis protein DltB [Paucilactobacillus nenjiangensis]QER67254.1 D-alanyl-lipoteichoic acid biosynthesis protein DltB [Paucilactobacillus nenjiangensis]
MINIQPYESPEYFVLILGLLLPIIIGLFYGKRLVNYETLFSLVFLVLTFGGDKWQQGVALIGYVLFELLVIFSYSKYRSKQNQTSVFVAAVLLAIAPLVVVKLTPLFSTNSSIIGFLGISYLTFKTVQMVMEMRDGAIKEFEPVLFVRFLLFFPTISSGPIDRFRRFKKDYQTAPDREKYLCMIDKAVKYLFLGFLYKFILGYFFGKILLPIVSHAALAHKMAFFHTGLSWPLVEYMYTYSMYLFFDFAGYSLFAIAISYLMGIESPMNFNQPFKSHNVKDFWNRWHMSLSFWFRDYVFMRFTFFLMKHKLIKNKLRISQVAYLANFLIMGFWHGVTWYYVLYGAFHAVAIIINDYWLRFKKTHNVPHNRWTEGLAIFTTFNVVCFSFLIFSGFLNTLWFK